MILILFEINCRDYDAEILKNNLEIVLKKILQRKRDLEKIGRLGNLLIFERYFWRTSVCKTQVIRPFFTLVWIGDTVVFLWTFHNAWLLKNEWITCCGLG